MTTVNHIRSSLSRRLTQLVVVFLTAGTLPVVVAGTATGLPQELAAVVSQSRQNATPTQVRVSSDPRAPKIDQVYGSRSVFTGQEENYRVRLEDGAYWPIQYNWELGDGTSTSGNNVVQRFNSPGNYRMDVRVRNAYGEDSTSIWISVLETPTPVVVAKENVGRSPAEAEKQASNVGDGVSGLSPESGSGYYFSWTLETHLNRQGAEHAAKGYSEMFPDHVRVFTDIDGSGATAYRVVVGRYATTGTALRKKSDIEEKAGRSVMLIMIRS